MADGLGPMDETTPVYVISVAATLSGLHPQTLRQYDRLGLVSPGRSRGGGRRYSTRDIALLRQVQELTSAGLGLEGVRRVLALQDEVQALRRRVVELEEQLAGAHAELRARGAGVPPYPRTGGEEVGAATPTDGLGLTRTGAELVPLHGHSTSLVVWRPRPRR